jgi:AbrB family looped-hinge helix DNA binding protein
MIVLVLEGVASMEITTPLVAKALAKKVVRVRDKNQITLPSNVIAGMPIRPGDFVELTRNANGVLEIRPVTLVPLVNTPGADASIAEAERDMAKGEYQTFSARQYADALRSRKKKGEKVAQASAHAGG